ncbi:hypothetical protein [Pseudomonas botevensis]|uniref:hypothetical protein n=1 Tax=Pseudomonas botevensis TaxID=2842352 RepID=UPI001C3C8DA0|nr:hypothetical protein [Pseudomonas botevensis]MBV4474266.1 hypothetical protein [Pseudomonas botevensis]
MAGCTFKQAKPPANLQFSKIERVGNTPLYDLHFSSDIDILGPYKSLIGVGLLCALENDDDFSEGHQMKRFMRGGVSDDSSGSHLDFVSQVVFSESVANGNSERNLTPAEIKKLLGNKKQVTCKFFASATMIDTYFSNVMYVPVESIIHALGQ